MTAPKKRISVTRSNIKFGKYFLNQKPVLYTYCSVCFSLVKKHYTCTKTSLCTPIK